MKKRPAAQQDYSLAQLPHTRKEVFFDVVKLYGGSLLKLGLILLSFALPLLIVGFIRDDNELAHLVLLQEASGEELAELYRSLQVSDGLISLFDVIGFLIFTLGLSGAVRIIRQYAWEEPTNLKLDLPKGMQQNAKAYLLLGLLTGCWVLLSRYCFKGALYANGGLVIANLLPVFLGLLVFLPLLGYAMVCNAVYANSFGQNLRISLILYFKKPLRSIFISLLLISLLLLVELIPVLAVRLLLRAVTVALAPFLLLVWFLWSYDQMDRHINPLYYPELVGRGLVHEDN